MARRQSTSSDQARRSRDSAAVLDAFPDPAGTPLFVGESADAEPAFVSLEQLIEHERGRLGHAESVLRCLSAALVHAEETNKNAAAYAHVATLVLRQIRECADRLDSVHIRPLIDQLKKDRNGSNGSKRGTRRR